jgi:uroporphyrinogen decarboxylase
MRAESPLSNNRFLRACNRQKVDCTPVWLMRQAGRYMKEFREIRKKHSLLQVAKTPELAAQVTLQPIKRLSVDAAIIFADILLPLEPMGIQLEFVKGEGPVIHNPVRDQSALEALRPVDVDETLGFVYEAIRIVRRELNGGIPLIGFAGAPFTLASYLVEGGHSRHYIKTKLMMYKNTKVWKGLLGKLASVITDYLRGQIRAGAQAVQIFDSWVGHLSPGDYENYVLPYSKQIMDGLKTDPDCRDIPVIHFGTGTSALLDLMRRAGGDVIGVDWRVNIDEAWKRVGYDVAIQGNLDPVALLGPRSEIERGVKDILRRVGGRPGHIFNLGHGILPETPVDHVQEMVEMVHHYSKDFASL